MCNGVGTGHGWALECAVLEIMSASLVCKLFAFEFNSTSAMELSERQIGRQYE